MESVDQLLKGIAKLGIKLGYLKRILPEWALDYPPQTGEGFLELKIHLARELGLDLGSLGAQRVPAFGALPTSPKFKRTRALEPGRLKPATSMFYSLAKALAAACSVPYRALPEQATAMRAEILGVHRTVNLGALLDYLWSHGIPVAHYSDWPTGLSRPTAMAVDVEGRPVIIVGSERAENGWHSFFVAHEAAHIAKGHVGRNEILVDGDEDSARVPSDDPQEIAADQYALSLLGGSEPIAFSTLGDRPFDLVSSLKELSQQIRVDRSHLVLRYGMQSNRWDIAMSTLQRIEAGADAPGFINRDHAEEALALDQLTEDRATFVRRALALR